MEGYDMEELKTNEHFQELSQEEAEFVEGGVHFIVGFVDEAQNVVDIAAGLAHSVAGIADNVLTGRGIFGRGGFFGLLNGGNGNGGGLLGGLLGGLFRRGE